MTHSPGPWLLKRDVNREQYSIRLHPTEPGAVGYREVCVVRFGYQEPAESEQHANAHLIAAAPDLLHAAREGARLCGNCSGAGKLAVLDESGFPSSSVTCDECAPIRAAIAKATGEQS